MDSITQSFIAGANADQQRQMQAIQQQQANMAMAGQLMQLGMAQRQMGEEQAFKANLPSVANPDGTIDRNKLQQLMMRYKPDLATRMIIDQADNPLFKGVHLKEGEQFIYQQPGQTAPTTIQGPLKEAPQTSDPLLKMLTDQVNKGDISLADAYKIRLGHDSSKFTARGFDGKRLVVEGKDTGTLVYDDNKEPYKGGQLKPLTQPASVAAMGQTESSFKPGTLNYMAEIYEKTGQVPAFGFGAAGAKQRSDFWNTVAMRAKDRGDTGAEQVARAAETKSLQVSLNQQQKNRGMMGGFVTNINGQVDKLEKMSQDIVKRVGIRALDVPLRELNTRFVGSGNENVFAAYMKEVSAEINKLSQGATASVAQLPEQNRQEWEKIHDVNLSMRELLKVLKGTKEMANIRLGSADKEITATMAKISGKGAGQANSGMNFDMNAIDAELKRRKGM